MRKRGIATLVAATVMLAASAGSVLALELRVASGGPPAHPSYNPMYLTFMRDLPKLSGGALTTKHFGLEVANLRSMPALLKSGVIDVGNVLPGYFPADFPSFALIAELAPLGQSGSAMAAATSEFFATCAPCLKEFTNRGILYTASASTPSYDIMSTRKPVRTVADLKGMRLRSPGGSFSRWIKAMGAIDQSPEVLGGLIGAALVGTFFGIFLAYGFVQPLANKVKIIREKKIRLYFVAKQTLIAYMNGSLPQVALEFGRKTISNYDRPTLDDVENEAMGTGDKAA